MAIVQSAGEATAAGSVPPYRGKSRGLDDQLADQIPDSISKYGQRITTQDTVRSDYLT
jgi:hypothetical protein